jgi:hypothetical protein
MLHPALLSRNGNEGRIRAETRGAGNRHAGVETECAGFVGGRADDAATVGASAHYQEAGPASALGVDQARDRDEHLVAVGEENAAGRGHGGKLSASEKPVGM